MTPEQQVIASLEFVANISSNTITNVGLFNICQIVNESKSMISVDFEFVANWTDTVLAI